MRLLFISNQHGQLTSILFLQTTRILANWVLNPIVGSEICDEPYLSELLFQILQLEDTPQELALCVMCALNNTSFYINYTDLDEGTMKTAERKKSREISVNSLFQF
jgi:hypothetical protein